MEHRASIQRVVSGIRPTGALHLGHYVGALRQWLAWQDRGECTFLVADVQALATHPERRGELSTHVHDVVLDWLAVGLDPARTSFALQSGIPELAELTLYLQMVVRTGELVANATTREEARLWGKGSLSSDLGEVDLGFLAYPASQAADILAFTTSPPGPGDRLVVPVGSDQVPHVAFAARLAERFNSRYGETFLVPQAETAETPRLPGVDGGSKMGKSQRNAILLKDEPSVVEEKVLNMLTDPLRVRPEDPGHPDACPCLLFREAFAAGETDFEERRAECLRGEADCEDCKASLSTEIQSFLAPIQARRASYASRPADVEDVLQEGTRKSRAVVRETVEHVREAMGLSAPDPATGVS